MSDNRQNRAAGRICATCIHYITKPPVEDKRKRNLVFPEVGRCRRHAPTVEGYPVVFPTDWCGDHKLDENKLA